MRKGALAAAAILLAVTGCADSDDLPIPRPYGMTVSGYHGGPDRLGWNDQEPTLTPARVPSLAPSWSSPPFDAAIVDGVAYAPHLYATPLYVETLRISRGPFAGFTTSVVIAATSNGDVHAINAATGTSVPAGTVLWSARLGRPAMTTTKSDGVPVGILGTPVLDLSAFPPRVYVGCADAVTGWQAHALDLGSGAEISGWPVTIDPASVEPVNVNRSSAGVAHFADFRLLAQRSALALSPDGGALYVPFGAYYDQTMGWIVAIDTAQPRVVSSFSGGPVDGGGAGMWAAGGPAVTADGRVFVTTGNSAPTSGNTPGVWGNSLVQFDRWLHVQRSYSPFNYCLLDHADTDLGACSPMTFDLDPAVSGTTHLAAFGGKQGSVYLVDRDALPGGTVRRPDCDVANPPSPDSDLSLLAPTVQSAYSPPSRGPLHVFGPYSDGDDDNQLDNAKMRSTPAFYRDASGATFLYVAGNSRDPADISTIVPPSLVRLRVVTAPGSAPYLAVDGTATDVAFKNPGSPIVTSSHGTNAVVWVVDENQKRTQPLEPTAMFTPAGPVLWAFDAKSMAPLWTAALGAPGGKYSHPIVVRGTVIAGTDRLRAFSLP